MLSKVTLPAKATKQGERKQIAVTTSEKEVFKSLGMWAIFSAISLYVPACKSGELLQINQVPFKLRI